MSQLSDTFEAAILNWMFRGSAFPTLATNNTLHLFTAAPTDSSGGTEVSASGTAYGSLSIPRGTARWSAPTTFNGKRRITTTDEWAFEQPSDSWGTVLAAAIKNATDTIGYWSLASTDIDEEIATPPKFAAGGIYMELGGHLTTYAADALLNHLFRGVALPTLGGSLYLALHSGDPGASGQANEITGLSRIGVTRGSGAWASPDAGGATSNANTIAFGSISSSLPQAPYVSIHDADTSGNALWYGPLTTPKPLNVGPGPQFAANELVIVLG